MGRVGLACAFLLGCGGPPPAPETPHEQQSEAYGDDGGSETLEVDYDFDAEPVASAGRATQDETWWSGDQACPEGSEKYGARPPESDRFGCKTEQGKNVGRITKFFSSGKKKEEGQYDDHFATGIWTAWDESGNKLSETPYVKGKKQGLETVWYPAGPIKSQRPFVNGKRHGIVFIWDDKERKRTALTYDAGKKHGPEARWSIAGDLARVIHWEHGVEKK